MRRSGGGPPGPPVWRPAREGFVRRPSRDGPAGQSREGYSSRGGNTSHDLFDELDQDYGMDDQSQSSYYPASRSRQGPDRDFFDEQERGYGSSGQDSYNPAPQGRSGPPRDFFDEQERGYGRGNPSQTSYNPAPRGRPGPSHSNQNPSYGDPQPRGGSHYAGPPYPSQTPFNGGPPRPPTGYSSRRSQFPPFPGSSVPSGSRIPDTFAGRRGGGGRGMPPPPINRGSAAPLSEAPYPTQDEHNASVARREAELDRMYGGGGGGGASSSGGGSIVGGASSLVRGAPSATLGGPYMSGGRSP